MGQITTVGGQDIEGVYFKNLAQHSSLWIGLFINNIDPNTFANVDFTNIVEPSASNYARVELQAANWVSYGGVASYPQVEFTVELEPFGTAYGCFLCTSVDDTGKVIALHKFPVGALLQYYGDQVRITPQMAMS